MINQHDRAILRELAQRVAEIAELPEMATRIARWKRHNSLQRERPMILIFPEGSWGELLPASAFQCEEQDARGIEWDLRSRIYNYEHFQSDNVVEKIWEVPRAIANTGWGLEAKHRPSTEARGAWAFDPVILDASDLKKLHYPEVSLDEEVSNARLTAARELFGDILDVRLRGVTHVSFHLMSAYTGWRGLEQVMVDMYDEPAMLHDAMAFLEEGSRKLIEQYIALNLLELNNNGTYHSSGGVGYTDELPPADYDPAHIQPRDMWASAEAQEMAQVSPEQHAEFILPYEKRLLAPFALTGYGCCEDLTRKLADVLTIPQIRRISIAPSANVDSCAEQLGGKAIFSWKPNPAYLVGEFSPEHTRSYVQHTLDAAARHGCVLEIILKDTHTCENHPERFDQWTAIVRELVNG